MDEDDLQYRDTAAQFIKEGLEQGQKVFYLYAETSPSVMMETLRQKDHQADQALLDGWLVIRSIKEFCLPAAGQPLGDIPGLIRAEVEKAAADGFPVVRCVIEVKPADPGPSELPDLVDYETALNEICAALPVIILCRYNRRQIDPRLLIELLPQHPQIITGGVLYENDEYIPSRELPSADGAGLRLNRRLDVLTRRQAGQRRVDQVEAGLAQHQQALAAETSRSRELERSLAEMQSLHQSMLEQHTLELEQRSAELQHEVHERQQVEAVLRESEGRYRALVNQSPLSILVEQDGHYMFANPAIVQRLGYDSAYELVGRAVADIAAPESNAPKAPQHIPRSGGRLNDMAIRAFYRKDGSIYYSENTSVSILYQGRPAVLVIGQDVSERVQYEQRLESSLEEKEVMLREIHHRVKNNLNVIIALIELQESVQTDPEVLQVFKELQTRAYTMALVHESLYRSPNLARIDFSKYLQTLVSHLYSAYGPSAGGGMGSTHGVLSIDMQVEVQNVALNVDTAIPCGLIVNELVTNALKYSFPAKRINQDATNCQIRVSLQHLGSADGDRLVLSVKDNGVGLPADFDLHSSQTLGMHLVQILSRQLGGELEQVADRGVHWKLIFTERNAQNPL